MNDSLTVLYLSTDEVDLLLSALEQFYGLSELPYRKRDPIVKLDAKIRSHIPAKLSNNGGGTGPY